MNVEAVLGVLVRPGSKGVRQADGGCDNNLCRYAQSCDCQPCNCDGPHQPRCIEGGAL